MRPCWTSLREPRNTARSMRCCTCKQKKRRDVQLDDEVEPARSKQGGHGEIAANHRAIEAPGNNTAVFQKKADISMGPCNDTMFCQFVPTHAVRHELCSGTEWVMHAESGTRHSEGDQGVGSRCIHNCEHTRALQGCHTCTHTRCLPPCLITQHVKPTCDEKQRNQCKPTWMRVASATSHNRNKSNIRLPPP